VLTAIAEILSGALLAALPFATLLTASHITEKRRRHHRHSNKKFSAAYRAGYRAATLAHTRQPAHVPARRQPPTRSTRW
jgi:hypothetical protein